jgi:hypothetical protein
MLLFLLASLWANIIGAPVIACDMREHNIRTIFIDRTPKRDDGSLSLFVGMRDGKVIHFETSTEIVQHYEGCPTDVGAIRIRVEPGPIVMP